MPSAFRTITWVPTPPGFVAQGLAWPSKLPLDTLDFSLDLSAWLQDAADTIVSVAASERSDGLTVATPTSTSGIVTAWLSGGLFRAAPYLVDIVVTTVGGRVEDFLITICVSDGPTKPIGVPTSPVLLAPNRAWFNAFRGTMATAPNWGALPTSQPIEPDAFWLNGGVVSIASNSSYLPSSPPATIGDLWNNGGVVVCNGNPGLPVSSGVTGTLLYNFGPLTVV
jgi:hypothetical protein